MSWIQVYDPLGGPWLSTAIAALPISRREVLPKDAVLHVSVVAAGSAAFVVDDVADTSIGPDEARAFFSALARRARNQ